MTKRSRQKTTLFAGGKEPGLRAASAAPTNKRLRKEPGSAQTQPPKTTLLVAEKDLGSARPMPRQLNKRWRKRTSAPRGQCRANKPIAMINSRPAMKVPTDKPEALSQADILVIGGGPAGSAAAIVLAERGHRVVQVEKSRHPVFTSASRCCRPTCPCSSDWVSLSRSRPSACANGAPIRVALARRPWRDLQLCRSWNKSLPFSYQVRRSDSTKS